MVGVPTIWRPQSERDPPIIAAQFSAITRDFLNFGTCISIIEQFYVHIGSFFFTYTMTTEYFAISDSLTNPQLSARHKQTARRAQPKPKYQFPIPRPRQSAQI